MAACLKRNGRQLSDYRKRYVHIEKQTGWVNLTSQLILQNVLLTMFGYLRYLKILKKNKQK